MTISAVRSTAILWLVALVVPSVPGHVFDGVPLGHPAELAVLLVCAFLFAANIAIGGNVAKVAAAVAVLLCGIKVALFTTEDPLGISACLRVTGITPPGACERSFDAPPGEKRFTRYDAALQFDPESWRLGALNSRRFDRLRSMSTHTPPVPFEITWTPQSRHLTTGPAQVSFCGRLAVADRAAQVVFDEASAVPIRRAMSVPAGGTVTFDSQPCQHAPLMRIETRNAAWSSSIVVAIDATFALASLLAGLVVASRTIARGPWIAIASTISSLIIWAIAPAGIADRLLNVTLALVGTTAAVGALGSLHAMILMIVPLWCRLDVRGIGVDFLPYPTASNDPLTYDSFARTMLEGSFLRGAEDVFYLQPFFRYVRYAEHLVFGEREYATVLVASLSLFAGWIWFAARVRPLATAPAFARALAAATSFTILVACGGLLETIAFGLTEYVVWILTPVMYGLLLARNGSAGIVAGGALAAACVITRFNLLVPVGVLLAIATLVRVRSQPRAVAACWAVVASIVSLPLLHNIWFGGSYAWLPTSAFVKETEIDRTLGMARISSIDMPFGQLFMPWRPHVRAYLWERLQWLTHFGVAHDIGPAAWLPGHGLQLLFIVALVWAFKRRDLPWRLIALALVPLSSLAVHVPYIVNVYYPRHIVFAYLAAGATILVWTGTPRKLHP